MSTKKTKVGLMKAADVADLVAAAVRTYDAPVPADLVGAFGCAKDVVAYLNPPTESDEDTMTFPKTVDGFVTVLLVWTDGGAWRTMLPKKSA